MSRLFRYNWGYRCQANLRLLGILLAASLAAVLACAPAARHAALDLSHVSLPQLQRDIDRNVSRLKTLKGRARISFESPSTGYSGYTRVAVRPPDSALIKIEALFGLDVGSLFIHGHSFAVYVPSEKRVYKGSVDRLRYLDPLTMAIDGRVLILALTGLWPLPHQGADVKGLDGDALLIEHHEDESLYRYWVEPTRCAVTRVEYEDAHLGLFYRLTFSRFVKTSGMMLPQMVTIERPPAGERLTLFYLERAVNVDPRALDIRQRLPSNVEEVLL
ncbi:MAG: DUF4292 domain-containing protein [Candidatus Oleimicrobiaceae bacterium]